MYTERYIHIERETERFTKWRRRCVGHHAGAQQHVVSAICQAREHDRNWWRRRPHSVAAEERRLWIDGLDREIFVRSGVRWRGAWGGWFVTGPPWRLCPSLWSHGGWRRRLVKALPTCPKHGGGGLGLGFCFGFGGFPYHMRKKWNKKRLVFI